MDFSISEKMKALLPRFAEFVKNDVLPLEQDFLQKGFSAVLPSLKEKRGKVRQLGLWAPQVPVKYGGMGLSLLEYGLVSEVLGQSPLGHFAFNCQAPDPGNMEILMRYGNEEQKEKYFLPLVEGKIRSCFSMTEPDYPGSNPVWMKTTVVRDGDDYVINGHKWFTTAADGATFAIVMAVTDPEADLHKRASMIIVPLNNPGFERVRNISVMGEAGSDWASHAEVKYENCRVPRKNLLGTEGEGFTIAQERLGPGRIHHCMRWIGICNRVYDLMCQRAAAREISPGDPLGSKQMVQAWIAESRAEVESARLLVLHTAWTIDHAGVQAAREQISLIKFHVAGVMMKLIDRAIQTHGALGITDDTPLSYFYRHERGSRIYDGPDEVHKVVVAKRALKKYQQSK